MSFSGPALVYTLALTAGLSILVVAVYRRHSSLGYCLVALVGMLWLINGLNIPAIEQYIAQHTPLETVILKDLAMIAMLPIFNASWVVAGYNKVGWALVARWLLPVVLTCGKIASWMDVRDRCAEPIGYTFDRCAIYDSPLYASFEGAMYASLFTWLIITVVLMYRGGDFKTPAGLSISLYLVGLLVCVAWVALAAVGVLHIALSGHLPGYQLMLRPIIATVATFMVLLGAAFFPSYLAASRAIFEWRVRKVQDYLRAKTSAPDRTYDSATIETMEHLKLALLDEPAKVDNGMSHRSARRTALWLAGKEKTPTHVPLTYSRRAQRRWLLWVAIELGKLEKASLWPL